tara:strand:- start:4356 stop:7550 length:3195 start_codon:yes stop_codon:yes gene_type:complete
MAIPRKEIELLKGGVETGSAERSPWVQNLWVPAGTTDWAVRPGFGQIAQMDTGLSAYLGLANTQVKTTPGFNKHLGSQLFTTHFGHEQILSIFWGTAYTDHQRKNARILVYAHIQDLETGASWSEPLYRHTAAMEEVSEQLQNAFDGNFVGTLAWFSAHQETNRTNDYRSFFSYDANPVFFTVINDANKNTTIVFGNKEIGLWSYYPTNLRTQEWHQKHRSYLQTLFTKTCHSGAAESAVIRPITPANGPFDANYTYRTTGNFPVPNAATSLNGRLVVADDTTLYFSDMGYPASFIGSNIEELPVTTPITALGQLNGNLLIFTKSETFFYAPSAGALQGGGRLMRVNDEIGCINNNALASTGSELFWVDKTGVYVTQNGLNITEASTQIQSFFRGGTSNPLNNYYQKNGSTDLTVEQPRTAIDFDANDNVSVTYHEQTGSLLVTVPSANMLWCKTKAWSAWTLESLAYAPSGTAAVGTAQNIINPWVMSSKSGIYVLGGCELQTLTDNITTGASALAAGNNNVLSSQYLLKLNHGGGLDRTVTRSEDQRLLPGQYECSTQWAYITGFTAGANTIYALAQDFGAQPNDQIFVNTGNSGIDGMQTVVAVGAGSVTTNKNSSSAPASPAVGVAQGLRTHCPNINNFMIVRPPELVFSETSTQLPATQQNVYRLDFEWVPASSAAGGGDLPVTLIAKIAFDVGYWTPVVGSAGGATVKFDLPVERLAHASSYTVQRQTIAGVADANGPVLLLQYNNTSGGNLNLAPNKYNPFVSVYFMHTNYEPDRPVSSYGFSLQGTVTTSWASPTSGTATGTLLPWNPYVVRRHQHDDVAQPVDWAYKTDQVGIKQGIQVRARGTYAILKSRGQPDAANLAVPGWPYGLYNTLLGSDWKDWSSQTIDIDNDLIRVLDKNTIRTRIRSTSTTLVDRVFGSARYGNTMAITGLAPGSPSVLTVNPNHGLVTNDIVTITDSNAKLNGTHTVTATPAANQFTIAVDSTGVPAVPGGTAVLHNAYLIDDQEVDTIATSDAARGESVSYMFFGFVRDIAQGLKMPSLKAVIEAVGGRRRRGR